MHDRYAARPMDMPLPATRLSPPAAEPERVPKGSDLMVQLNVAISAADTNLGRARGLACALVSDGESLLKGEHEQFGSAEAAMPEDEPLFDWLSRRLSLLRDLEARTDWYLTLVSRELPTP